MFYFSPVAVPGVTIKVTASSHARVPVVVSSTFTLNILPSVTLAMVCRDTVASVENQIGYVITKNLSIACLTVVHTSCFIPSLAQIVGTVHIYMVPNYMRDARDICSARVCKVYKR